MSIRDHALFTLELIFGEVRKVHLGYQKIGVPMEMKAKSGEKRGVTETIRRNKVSFVIPVLINFELLSPSPPRDESAKGVGTCACVKLAPNELFLVIIFSLGG